LIIITFIHGVHILFFFLFLFLFLLILILTFLGLIIIKTCPLVPSHLKLTLIVLILNIIIAASIGVTSKVGCLCTLTSCTRSQSLPTDIDGVAHFTKVTGDTSLRAYTSSLFFLAPSFSLTIAAVLWREELERNQRTRRGIKGGALGDPFASNLEAFPWLNP
jgi:hypothetical protein